MIIETFLKAYCPDCDSPNWLHCGDDALEYPAQEIGGFKCWKCKRVFIIGDDQALGDEEDADLYNTGKRKPI